MRAALAALVLLLHGVCLAQALPQAGTAWKYGYADLLFGRGKQVFTIRAVTVTDARVSEAFAVNDGPERQIEVDSRAVKYQGRLLAADKSLLEFQPYGIAGAPRFADATGYPTSAATHLEWKISVKPPVAETVTVPAGTFDALRVEIEGSRGIDEDPFWRPKQAGRFRHTIWYAPEAGGRYVKARHQSWSMTASPFQDEQVELLEYRQK